MSNNFGWKPRKSEKWTCPSGQEVWTRAPGPEFTLRLGRTQRSFSGGENLPKRRPEQTDEEYGREVLEKVSDEDLVTFARELLVAMVETPKLALEPNEGLGEIGPEDTGADFWPLYQYGMAKYFTVKEKVQVGDGEVEAKTLETFREEPGISGDSVDGVHVSITESQPTTTDQGLAGSAGA